MTAIENIRSAQAAALVDEDGDAVNLTLGRPLTAEEIDSLQQQVGVALPEELRSLLAFCSGIEGCAVEIDFTGASMMFGQEEVFPNGLPIAADGFGNFWVLDIAPQTPKVAPVFFTCHDAPVILYQSPNLSSFLSEVFRMYSPHQRSLISEVPEAEFLRCGERIPGSWINQAHLSHPMRFFVLLHRGCHLTFRLLICAALIQAWDFHGGDMARAQS